MSRKAAPTRRSFAGMLHYAQVQRQNASAMKASYYNVLVEREGEDTAFDEAALLYNTRTMSLAALDDEELAAYKSIESLDRENEVCAALAEQGFVLDDPEAEANLLRYEFEKYRFDDHVLELYLAPTLSCNFNCPYCFERKRPGRMSEKVQDAVLSFIAEQYNERPYQTLKIVWYGGEPLLAMDVIEALSARFISFCGEHGVEYSASVISNTALADENVQDKLIECGVWSVMTTVDGMKGYHEARRVNRDGRSTFDVIMDNVESMTSKGICVDFRCILEKGNVESCMELTGKMARHENLGIRVKPMIELGASGDGALDGLDLEPLSKEEFAQAYLQVFRQAHPRAADYERELSPLRLNCSACKDRGFAIDELGNVSNCGCTIGDDSKTFFNICEPVSEREVNWDLISWYGSKNPLDTPYCRTCRVLPLCQGGCLRVSDPEPFHNCNPLRYCIEDMVKGFYAALTSEGGV